MEIGRRGDEVVEMECVTNGVLDRERKIRKEKMGMADE